jgi:hypothetical protein
MRARAWGYPHCQTNFPVGKIHTMSRCVFPHYLYVSGRLILDGVYGVPSQNQDVAQRPRNLPFLGKIALGSVFLLEITAALSAAQTRIEFGNRRAFYRIAAVQ